MLTDKEIEHIAKLARINLKDDEKERLKKDLSSVLDYIAKLNEVDTDSVEPLYQTTGLVNAERSDETRNEFPTTEKLDKLLVGQAPHKHNRFVKVKPVLTKK